MKDKGVVQIFSILARILFGMVAVSNIWFSVSKEISHINVFSLAIIVVWGYGILGNLGIIKSIVAEDEDGVIVYDTPVPFLQVGIIRILQFAYARWKYADSLQYGIFIGLVIMDCILTLLLLLDKSNYYYVSIKEDE